MDHLKSFKMFENREEHVDIEFQELIEEKGNIKDTIEEYLNFSGADKFDINMDYSVLINIAMSDFELFTEILDALFVYYDKDLGDITKRNLQFLFNDGAYKHPNPELTRQLFDYMINQDFHKFLHFIGMYGLYSKKANFGRDELSKYFTLEELREKLTQDQLITLDNINALISYGGIVKWDLHKADPLTVEEIINAEGNIYELFRRAYDENPTKTAIDGKTLTRLMKKDFDVFLETVGVIARLIQENDFPTYRNTSADSPIDHLTNDFHEAIFKSQRSALKSKKGPYGQHSTMGPHINSIVKYLAKQGRVNDILQLHSYITETYNEDYSFSLTPGAVKDFPREILQRMVDAGAVKFSDADRRRLLEEHDQYSTFINAPSYKRVIDLFDAIDDTTDRIKKNGNLRMEIDGREYKFNSYGRAARPLKASSGILFDLKDEQGKSMKADTPEGAEKLFDEFIRYMSRVTLRDIKKDTYGDYIKRYQKQNPIETKTASSNEWVEWYKGLAMHIGSIINRFSSPQANADDAAEIMGIPYSKKK